MSPHLLGNTHQTSLSTRRTQNYKNESANYLNEESDINGDKEMKQEDLMLWYCW